MRNVAQGEREKGKCEFSTSTSIPKGRTIWVVMAITETPRRISIVSLKTEFDLKIVMRRMFPVCPVAPRFGPVDSAIGAIAAVAGTLFTAWVVANMLATHGPEALRGAVMSPPMLGGLTAEEIAASRQAGQRPRPWWRFW